MTAKHPVVQKAMYLLSLQAAETYDQIIFNVIDAATSAYYAGNVATSDATLLASNTVAYTDLVAIDALINDQGGKPMEGGDFAFVCSSQVYAGLLKDPDWFN